MIYISGDKHGRYESIVDFCKRFNTTKSDAMIILGDNGVNYYGDRRDRRLKEKLSELPITFIMIRGNHDMRPPSNYVMRGINRDGYRGWFLVEDEFPSLLFTVEYGLYDFAGNKTFVIGGAYSVDKYYRLEMYDLGNHNYRWFYNEQLSDDERRDCLDYLDGVKQVDCFMTHTCPLKYEPVDMFMSGVDQDKVETTMEEFLDEVEETIPYKKWYCGHWHTDRTIDRIRFMFGDIIALQKKE